MYSRKSFNLTVQTDKTLQPNSRYNDGTTKQETPQDYTFYLSPRLPGG